MKDIALGIFGAVIVIAIGGLLYAVKGIIQWLEERE